MTNKQIFAALFFLILAIVIGYAALRFSGFYGSSGKTQSSSSGSVDFLTV